MSTFCATCLTDASCAGLELERIDGRNLVLCRDCSAGSLRGGRWSFDDSGKATDGPAGGVNREGTNGMLIKKGGHL